MQPIELRGEGIAFHLEAGGLVTKVIGKTRAGTPLSHIGATACRALISSAADVPSLAQLTALTLPLPPIWNYTFAVSSLDVPELISATKSSLDSLHQTQLVHSSICEQSGILNEHGKLLALASKRVRLGSEIRDLVCTCDDNATLVAIGHLHRLKCQKVKIQVATESSFETLGQWDLSSKVNASALLSELTDQMHDNAFLQRMGLQQFLTWVTGARAKRELVDF